MYYWEENHSDILACAPRARKSPKKGKPQCLCHGERWGGATRGVIRALAQTHHQYLGTKPDTDQVIQKQICCCEKNTGLNLPSEVIEQEIWDIHTFFLNLINSGMNNNNRIVPEEKVSTPAATVLSSKCAKSQKSMPDTSASVPETVLHSNTKSQVSTTLSEVSVSVPEASSTIHMPEAPSVMATEVSYTVSEISSTVHVHLSQAKSVEPKRTSTDEASRAETSSTGSEVSSTDSSLEFSTNQLTEFSAVSVTSPPVSEAWPSTQPTDWDLDSNDWASQPNDWAREVNHWASESNDWKAELEVLTESENSAATEVSTTEPEVPSPEESDASSDVETPSTMKELLFHLLQECLIHKDGTRYLLLQQLRSLLKCGLLDMQDLIQQSALAEQASIQHQRQTDDEKLQENDDDKQSTDRVIQVLQMFEPSVMDWLEEVTLKGQHSVS